MVREELHVRAINLDLAGLLLLQVIFTTERREAPVLADDNLLTTGELVLRTTKCLDSGSTMRITGADGENDLADVHAGDRAVGLAPGSTHTSLQTIGTGARQHLVDTDDVIRMSADTKVETVLSGDLDEILVGANTSRFEGLRAQLFVLVGDEMNAERELINTSALPAEIKDTDLRVRHTTVETGLWVRLVFAVAVASCRAARSRLMARTCNSSRTMAI